MWQDRQCAYNVLLRRVHVTILPLEISKYYMFWVSLCRLGYPAWMRVRFIVHLSFEVGGCVWMGLRNTKTSVFESQPASSVCPKLNLPSHRRDTLIGRNVNFSVRKGPNWTFKCTDVLAEPNGVRDVLIWIQQLHDCNKQTSWFGLIRNFPWDK